MTAAAPDATPKVISYALEQLFVDQERDWVTDTIAPVLAWVPGASKLRSTQPFRFEVEHTRPGTATLVSVALTWDSPELEHLVPGLSAHARRLRTGLSAQREHVTELAAYGLTFVAISALMPGRRVKAMRKGSAPDILLDVTPGALRGVEAAGRAAGGRSKLLEVREEKAPKLRARTDIAELHFSLWCASPRISIMEQVKP